MAAPYELVATWAPLPTAARGSSVVLSANSDATDFTYCAGEFVVVRNLRDPSVARVYTGHRAAASVARFAPSSAMIASGDAAGQVHVWPTDRAADIDLVADREVSCIAGAVRDIAWDFESRRIVAVGEGRGDKFGHAFLVDTGAAAGAIVGHTKAVNATSMRPKRPLYCVSAGDDTTINFHAGPPFALKTTLRGVHSRFVTSVKYHPDGQIVATASLDGKIAFIDTDKLAVEGDPIVAHNAGIYALSFSPDGRQILTSSADGSAKLWDVETKTEVMSWAVGSSLGPVDGQQLGNLWAGEHLISVGLTGTMSFLDPRSNTVSRKIEGHMGLMSTFSRPHQRSPLVSGSRDGRIAVWDEASGAASVLNRNDGPTGIVSAIAAADPEATLSDVLCVSEDCTVRRLSVKPEKSDPSSLCDLHLTLAGPACKVDEFPGGFVASLPSKGGFLLPRANNSTGGPMAVDHACASQVPTVSSLAKTACAIIASTDDGSVLATAAERGGVVVIHKSESGNEHTEAGRITTRLGDIKLLAFSPDNKHLVIAGAAGPMELYEVATLTRVNEWGGHSSRATAVAFSPNSQYAASSGVDGKLILWSVEKKRARTEVRGAHHGVSFGVAFDKEENNVVYSAGPEGIRKWRFNTMP